MRSRIYAAPEYIDRPLRVKTFDPNDLTTFDDPDWPADALAPNVVRLTIDTTANGDWTIEVLPVDGATELDGSDAIVPDPIEYTVAGDSEDEIEDEFRALLTTAIAAGEQLERYYSAVIEDPADPASMLITVKPDAPYHTIALTPAAGGAMHLSPDDTYPITGSTSNYRSADAKRRTQLAVTIVAVDAQRVPVPNDNGCTLTVEAVRAVERHLPYEADNATPLDVVSKRSAPEATFDIDEELRIPWDGGLYTVRLSDCADPPTDAVAFEVHVRPVQE